MNKNIILIILALGIVGAVGYFVVTNKPATDESVIQPPQNQTNLQSPISSTQCPDTATFENITNLIGTPTIEEGRPPQFQLWVEQKLTKLHEEFSRNLIRCDINEQYQLTLKTVPFPQEGDRINYSFQASLRDKNNGSETIVLPQLGWIGPAPWGNTYGPFFLELTLKSDNILELEASYQGGVEYYLVNLSERKFKASYSLWTGELGGPQILIIKRDSQIWTVKLVIDTARPEGEGDLLRGLAVNDNIVIPLDVELVPIYAGGLDFSLSAFFNKIEFNQDFSKVSFDAEVCCRRGSAGAAERVKQIITIDLK